MKPYLRLANAVSTSSPAGRYFGPHRIAFAQTQLLVYLSVSLQHLHRKIARRETLGQLVGMKAHVAVQAAQPLFDHCALSDVDVAHAFVPVFVDRDYRVQQVVDSPVVARFDRYHRHAEHPSQIFVVQLRTAGRQFVEHVERHNHARVYVDQFRRQIEVALQVGRHHRIDDHIGHFPGDVPAHETFFGRVGRQGIGAGQVGNLETIAAVAAYAAFGAHRHSAVIAHMLVAARNGVEKRRLAAVGIAHQRHADRMAVRAHHFVERPAAHLFRFVHRRTFGRRRRNRMGAGHQFVGFVVREHLDHVGFAASQRHVVSHDPVLDRVFERCVQNHFDPLVADEPHLHDPATEPAMAQHFQNNGRFSGLQFGQTHSKTLLIFERTKIVVLLRMHNPHFWVFFSRASAS